MEEVKTSTGNQTILVVLGSLIIILGISSLILFFQNRLLRQQLSEATTTPSPTPTSTASVDPTADWETYANQKYGFSFKYPSDWEMSENANPGISDLTIVSIKKIYEGEIYIQLGPTADGTDNPELKIEVETASLNGKTVTLKKYYRNGTFGQKSYEIKLEKDIISILLSPDQNQNKSFETLDQILSTFKFTPQNLSTSSSPPLEVELMSTTGWTTAENSVFSIQYPSDTFRPITNSVHIQLQWKNNNGDLMVNSPDFLIDQSYSPAQTIQEWYLDKYNYYANEVSFTTKKLGELTAIEAKPSNQTLTNNILVKNNDTLINVIIQGADLKLVETIVSTMKFK